MPAPSFLVPPSLSSSAPGLYSRRARALGTLAALAAVASLAAAPAVPAPAAAAYADALLARMTLREKIGQTVIFTSRWSDTGPTGAARDVEQLAQSGDCGSVFNARTVAYIRKLQTLAVEKSRLHVPLLFGYDVIHGYNTIFPIPLAEASSWDLPAIEAASRVAAVEAAASGLNWTFAPMVDIARDSRWGRIAEGAGEDPFLGAQIARARVRGFQGRNFDDALTIMACVKHFAAYGAVQAGRDYGTTDLSERTLREVYLPPYAAAVQEGAWSVMTAFNDLNGVPATANRFLLHDILRGEWGFRGFVVTDYNAVRELVDHGVAEDTAVAARRALDAGVDLDMQSGAFLDDLPKEVAAGRVKPTAIDAAARRVLEAKYTLGLAQHPFRYLDEKREEELGRPADHLAAARDMARRSMVLLKNKGSLLPLRRGTKIAVIGPLGDDRRDLLGCWKAAGKADGMRSIFQAIQAANTGGTTTYARGCEIVEETAKGFAAAVAAAQEADVVVLALGESALMSGEAASRTSISLPGRQSDLVRAVERVGKPIVTVLINGRPLAVPDETARSAALLEAWFPGSAGGQPVADVLFGDFNPAGKLPVTFPRCLGQVPIYYSQKNTGRPFHPELPHEKYRSTYLDSPNDPLFPFGFGLSYTTFTYSQLRVDRPVIRPGETVTVTVRLTNAGAVPGTEVAQLYIRDLVGSVTRPVRELKGFARVELKPGESRDVRFTLAVADLAFWRADQTWGAEPGKFQVFVGGSSQDGLAGAFELAGPR